MDSHKLIVYCSSGAKLTRLENIRFVAKAKYITKRHVKVIDYPINRASIFPKSNYSDVNNVRCHEHDKFNETVSLAVVCLRISA